MKIIISLPNSLAYLQNGIVKYLHTKANIVLQKYSPIEFRRLQSLNFEASTILITAIVDGGIDTDTIDMIFDTNQDIKIIGYLSNTLSHNVSRMNIPSYKSFISTLDCFEELYKAISIVHEGGVYISDRAWAHIQTYLLSFKTNDSEIIVTNDEKHLLELLCKGYSSTQIGKIINKSPRTVEKYRIQLYEKFGVENKEQLISLAAKKLLLT